jgi:hypothetical protein
MIKQMESADGRSCWNKASKDEMVFVLLGRDKAAPHAIREWAKERIRLNKNKPDDQQVLEALNVAEFIERGQCCYWKSGRCTLDPKGILCECKPGYPAGLVLR